MSRTIDINADLGEQPDEVARDLALMRHISSCNIACGGHAGDAESMATMLSAARDTGVAAGAHPSYPDRAGFGRTSMAIAAPDLAPQLIAQVGALAQIAADLGVPLTHIKPHGALYNDLADDEGLAHDIATALHRAFPHVALVGLAHGAFAAAAEQTGARFIAEAFIDRAYTPARRLVPRNQPGALIARDADRAAQATALALGKPVRAIDGSLVEITAHSLCIHSDSAGAEQTALRIAQEMISLGIIVCPPGASPA
ncbi:5-oxoprolinase subunit PxpA [Blastomonas sp.]|uniref:5-oxoprolinase subunit PxpA n=1 Tax=Blastomonas sp. TaxID=1909299 RepID=UPI0035943597